MKTLLRSFAIIASAILYIHQAHVYIFVSGNVSGNYNDNRVKKLIFKT